MVSAGTDTTHVSIATDHVDIKMFFLKINVQCYIQTFLYPLSTDVTNFLGFRGFLNSIYVWACFVQISPPGSACRSEWQQDWKLNL